MQMEKLKAEFAGSKHGSERNHEQHLTDHAQWKVAYNKAKERAEREHELLEQAQAQA